MRAYHIKEQGWWVDLDHILGISEPEFVDRMGCGGYFVEFYITMTFKDSPLVVSFNQEAVHTHGEPVKPERLPNGQLSAMPKARACFEKLLEAWRNV